MNLTSVEKRLFSLPGRGAKTFERMRALDQRLSHPHHSFKSIHIAGTNGKGSVSLKIASVLENLGYKVGLYTSPHIWCYRERIQINGQMISETLASKLLGRVFDPNLSFFDCLTAIAFLYFAEEKVDFAVIETGLGGRFDATNIITPILSIITSIGYDHMAILGRSLEEIAFEKGGIVKPNIPIVVGSSASSFFPNAVHVPSQATYEIENRLIAKYALAQLGISLEKGLEKTPFCRFQKIGSIIFDAAHNPPAFIKLKEALKLHFPGKKFPFYLVFSKDKEWQNCVSIISDIASCIAMIKSSHPYLNQTYPGYEMVAPEEIKEGVVAGSFYIFSDLIQNKDGALSLLN